MTKQTSEAQLGQALTQFGERHAAFLGDWLARQPAAEPRLHDAMQYVLLNGGKRVRPFLVYATGTMLGIPVDELDYPAAAVECIHAYSLVHDDLPAMDDDNLRRGQPTCHIEFDEATAILTGDALQALAFELLTEPAAGPAARQGRMVRILSQAAGARGMCGGQALDIAATGQAVSASRLQQIHSLKTGALIEAAVGLGMAGNTQLSAPEQEQLQQWARLTGLAFQVQDDILDEVSDTATLGKTQGKDVAEAKATYPAQLGLTGARNYLRELTDTGLQALAGIPYNTALLENLTYYLIKRDR